VSHFDFLSAAVFCVVLVQFIDSVKQFLSHRLDLDQGQSPIAFVVFFESKSEMVSGRMQMEQANFRKTEK
jgi:hypothetical protein